MSAVLLETIKDCSMAGANIKCVVQDMGTQNLATLRKMGIICTRKDMCYKVCKLHIFSLK
jgi:hypothetical protein